MIKVDEKMIQELTANSIILDFGNVSSFSDVLEEVKEKFSFWQYEVQNRFDVKKCWNACLKTEKMISRKGAQMLLSLTSLQCQGLCKRKVLKYWRYFISLKKCRLTSNIFCRIVEMVNFRMNIINSRLLRQIR